MPYAPTTSHSIFLLKLASGTSHSKCTPAINGLFLSLPLHYNNDINLLISTISLPLTNWDNLTSHLFFHTKTELHHSMPNGPYSSGLSTKTWFISHPTKDLATDLTNMINCWGDNGQLSWGESPLWTRKASFQVLKMVEMVSLGALKATTCKI